MTSRLSVSTSAKTREGMKLTTLVHGTHGALFLLHECLGGRFRLVLLETFLAHFLDRFLFLLLVLFLLLLEITTELFHEARERAFFVRNELRVRSFLSNLSILEADDVVTSWEEVEGVRDEEPRLVRQRTADRVIEKVLSDVSVDLEKGARLVRVILSRQRVFEDVRQTADRREGQCRRRSRAFAQC